MEVCGEAESKLAYEQSQHEVQLERDFLEPLNQLAEVSPNSGTKYHLVMCIVFLLRLQYLSS